MNKIYIGVDPGINGAIAIFHPEYQEVCPIIFYDDKWRFDIYSTAGLEIIACIEKVWKPVKLVRLAGIIEGVLIEGCDKVSRVAPSTWRKAILDNSHATKQDAIDFCNKYFPKISLFRTEKSRVEDHNFAEALCIAEYARRYL